MRLGWGADDPAFCQLFTPRMMPGASKEEADAFNELQRRTTSAEMAARYFATVGDFDINDLLAKVTVPTLVMHARGDLMQPFEKGRRIASAILGARFVALQSNNHMFLPVDGREEFLHRRDRVPWHNIETACRGGDRHFPSLLGMVILCALSVGPLGKCSVVMHIIFADPLAAGHIGHADLLKESSVNVEISIIHDRCAGTRCSHHPSFRSGRAQFERN
jgi:hypothetical protein